jgi:hypothetical protein
MKRYLIAMYQPDGPPGPAVDLDRIRADLDVIRADMQAAGAWVFADGLHPVDTATVVRHQDGELLITDGPYLEGKEHLGGFTIVNAPDLDTALGWARRSAVATGLPVEVRPFFGEADASA